MRAFSATELLILRSAQRLAFAKPDPLRLLGYSFWIYRARSPCSAAFSSIGEPLNPVLISRATDTSALPKGCWLSR
jgi:hypothetical protein